MENLGGSLFRRIIILCELPFETLCKLQGMNSKWRTLLSPAPHHSEYWESIFVNESGNQMTEKLMKIVLPGIRSMRYSGLQSAEVWFLREQRQMESRIQFHRDWLRGWRKKKIPFRYLSQIARSMIRDERIWRCESCSLIYHGPRVPKLFPPEWECRKLSTLWPQKGNLDLSSSSRCTRCWLYGRKLNSKLCLFCDKRGRL